MLAVFKQHVPTGRQEKIKHLAAKGFSRIQTHEMVRIGRPVRVEDDEL